MGIFSLVKGKIMQYLTPILVIMFIGMAGTIVFLGHKYTGAKEEIGSLDEKLKQRKVQVDRLQRSLVNERQAMENLANYQDTIKTHTEDTLNEARDIKTADDIPALDPSAVAIFMCERGYATTSACAATYSTFDTKGP